MIDQIQDNYNQPVYNHHTNLTPSKIKQLLKSSFDKLSQKSPSNSELSRAHLQISQAMKSQHFLDTLIALLIQFQGIEQKTTFVKQIMTTFTTYIRHQQSRSSLVKRIDFTDLNKKLLQLFLDQQILQSNRYMLLKCYPQFIYANGMETIRHQTIDSFCTAFGIMTIHIKNQVEHQDFLRSKLFQNMSLYVGLAHSLTKGPIQQSHMKNILRTFLVPMLYATNKLIILIQVSITSKNQPLYLQISYRAQKFMDFFRDMMISIAKDYMSHVRSDFLKEPLLLNLLKVSLSLSLQAKNPNELIQVIVKSNGNKYLERINQIKKNVFDIIHVLARLTLTAQQSSKQSSKPQYQIPYEIIKFILQKIVQTFVKQFQMLEYPKNELPNKGIYISFMKTLAKIVKIFKFYNESENYRDFLIFDLCLPLLQRTQHQKIASAQDFKGKRQDILNMHSADIPQNAACVLIQAYIDKVDGSISHFSKQIVNMIYFHLTANPNCFQALPSQLTQSYFFKKVDYVNQIECGLIILALLSYMAPGRADIVELIQKLLLQKRTFFFRKENPGTFKSAVLLCYTFYIDNFYQNLVKNKSSTREFHLQVLQECCLYVKQYTQIKQKSLHSKQELISLQIGALQALDCLQNSLGQVNLLPALFWVQQTPNDKTNEQIFINIFNFLAYELKYQLNINVIDILMEFYREMIKNQCQKGFALRRLHYEYKNVPSIVRCQLSTFLVPELYKLYNQDYIPNKKLIHTKIMVLISLIFTCCQNPHQFINSNFFNLKTEEQNTWDRVDVIDTYLRRMIILKKQGFPVQYPVLQSILQFSKTLINDIIKTGQFKNLFGVFMNLIVLSGQLIDKMIEPLGTLLIKLLDEEQKTQTYNQQLEDALSKSSYLLMVAIQLRINQANSRTWGSLVEIIYKNLLQKSSQGFLIFTNSSDYIGKLLTLCLVFLYNMRKFKLDVNVVNFLWTNAIKVTQVYKSTTEKLIVCQTIIKLLEQKQTIPQTDLQCRIGFKMVCTMLYSISSKFFSIVGNQVQSENQDSFGDSDSSEENHQEDSLNYKEYTITCNQYILQDKKQAYIFAFKNLCHKLKKTSSQFLKNSLQELASPISNFVKEKVFYFEGSFTEKGLRRFVKVKK